MILVINSCIKMYRKIVWCYVFILTLLDISLNTKLSAQGKSHGVTVHDSLIEGITFQEWGKESLDEAGGAGGAGRAVPAGALSLSPRALHFGRAALAAPHALTVTLTNTANTTLHLASVAGTTPDFHASFFDAKTLPPQSNTTFSVVYLGRREGPVTAHLYIHTSLGVHKYPVSAVGVASEWGVWPLVGVRVPLNASLEPLLTVYNPTDHTVQVSEVYSSGSWLGLQLPDGGVAAPARAWSLPPRAHTPLVRLRIALHQLHRAHQHTLTAYVRIKANITGGGLVVCVEARPAPPGEFASPLHLRLRTRGSDDPADVLDISAGNSASLGVSLDASVWAARCSPTPYSPQAPPTYLDPPTHNGDTKGTANGNGVRADGVYVSLVRSYLEPHQQLTRTAQLTLDYAKMWAGYSESEGSTAAAGAWCGGWVVLGRAAVPYSVRLLPGTLRLDPPALHFVSAHREEWSSVREVRVHNEFPGPVHLTRVDHGPQLEQYFEVESVAPLTLAGGEEAVVARVRPRRDLDLEGGGEGVRSHLILRTNLTDYELPVLAYSGRLDLEWEWPNSLDGTLRLGAVGASSTRRVRARVHNRGVVTLCVRDLRADLPGAQLHLAAEHEHRCVEAGGSVWAWLTVVAPARLGPQSGQVVVRAAPAHAPPTAAAPATTADVHLTVELGRVHAHPLTLTKAAPYAWSSAPLVLDSTMELTVRVESVTLPPDDPALAYEGPTEGSSGEVSAGRHTVGTVVYAPERLCQPDCYTGLDINTTDGIAWLSRSDAPDEASLLADAALQSMRHALYLRRERANISMHVHTDRVVQIPVTGVVNAWWPRLAASSGDAGLAGVGGALPLRIRARNPSRSHPLLLQPVIAGPLSTLAVVAESAACRADRCIDALDAFRLMEWRATRGAVRTWRGDVTQNITGALPLLLLAPDAEVELKLSFAPTQPAALTAYLYLRNNLTIMEGVQLSGHGAYPSFEIGGRRPGTNSPLLFEVSECGDGAGGTGGVVRRTVMARNTGRVRVRLREWRVAGEACAARGFRLAPCAPLTLAPNESRPITVAFAPDWTLARVAAALTLRSELGRATFTLSAAVPAPLLARCAAAAPPPPWHSALRAAGTLLALAALALVLAAAALDAERELRRARAARPPPAPRQPLDLRALAEQPQQAPPPPVVRRTVGRKRRPARVAPDPAIERSDFERWRREVLRPRDDDAERSSEDNEPAHAAPDPSDMTDTAPLLTARDEPQTTTDEYEHEPDTEERPTNSGDDDAVSSGSGSASATSSSPTADVDEQDEGDECDHSDHSPPRARTEPTPGAHSPVTVPRASSACPPVDAAVRAPRQRRDNNETPRRTDRHKTYDGVEHTARSRPTTVKHHARKDKVCKRRERTTVSPARSPHHTTEPRAGGALRWGESWSSVVAARAPPLAAPLAPIGSDVRRRTEPPPTDNSLFYFNGDSTHAPPTQPDFTWRPPPQVERPAFSPSRDFLDEPSAVGNGSYRLLNSVWGTSLEPRPAAPAAAAWLWGSLGADSTVRPPPGFGPPPRPVRPYDPFRSLASIWAPGALDWRADSPDETRK